MKAISYTILVLFTFSGFAQTPDSITIVKQIDSLIQVNRSLVKEQKWNEALQVIEQAKQIAIENFGESHLLYPKTIFNQGRTYHIMNNFVEAEKYYTQAKSIQERAAGRNHLDYANSLHNLASLYRMMRQYKKAELLYLKNKDLRKRLLGNDHPDYGNSLHRLGVLYFDLGQYEKAEPLYLKCIDIWKKKLGKEHPGYAAVITNIALLYRAQGNYKKAEPWMLESKDIKERIYGKEHPNYTNSLENLGVLYQDLGQYEKSEPLILECRDIREKILGKEHPDYANSLNNLGNLFWFQGQYKKVEPLYLESKDIRKRVLGNDHPDYAQSLHNLANLYRVMRQYKKAERLFLETNDIIEQVLGKEHPFNAANLNKLALIYQAQKQYKKAEPLFLESKNIRERTLGKNHPLYAASLNNLASLNEIFEQNEAAEVYLAEAVGIHQSRLSNAISFLSEKELSNYIQLFVGDVEQMLGFALERNAKQVALDQLPSLCFDNLLFYKGFLLNSAKQINKLASKSPETMELYNDLKSYRRRLAKEYAKTILIRDSTTVANLEERANVTEKKLANEVAGYSQATQQVNWKEVQATLNVGEACIEFVHFKVDFPEETDSTLYAALVLLPDNQQPKFIPLFEEKQLEVLLSRKIFSTKLFVDKLYTPKLHQLIWQPIDTLLREIQTVYYSPSGLLHRIAFPAIPSGDSLVADQYNLQYVSSTRNLVFKDSLNNNEPVTSAIVYGGITYGADSTEIAMASPGVQRSEEEYHFNETELLPQDSTRGRDFGRLDTTLVELNLLEQLFKSNHLFTMTLEGYTASEESFKAIGQQFPSPDILHIATHGFFFPDPEIEKSELNNFLDDGKSNFKYADNPLLRSGLILAGANHAWKKGEPLPGFEDGILTAYEISNMDLTNTKLVVLSACKTGLGEIKGSEGVYGLQRAFKMAGVNYLMITLWNIPDSRHTVEFMEAFYTKWIIKKMPIREAFNLTQDEMREKYPDPYYWAGFVLIE